MPVNRGTVKGLSCGSYIVITRRFDISQFAVIKGEYKTVIGQSLNSRMFRTATVARSVETASRA